MFKKDENKSKTRQLECCARLKALLILRDQVLGVRAQCDDLESEFTKDKHCPTTLETKRQVCKQTSQGVK